MIGNACKLGKKLDKVGLALIKSWRAFKPNWQELIKAKFEYADDIIATIEGAGEGWNTLSLDSFNNLEKSNTAEPIKTQNQFFVPDDNVIINYNGDSAAVTKMLNDFRKAMVKASIFNSETGHMVKPAFKAKDEVYSNALNENIYKYKQALIGKLLDYLNLGISIKDVNFTSPEVLVNLENIAIAEFSNIVDNKEDNKYLEARDAYTVLKNFDNLIKRECPFIGIKPKYSKGREGFDKYTYEGVNTEMFTAWTTKEEVDINGQMSKMLSTLLSVFPKVLSNGNPIPDSNIPLREFHQVATKFKDWLLTIARPEDFGIKGNNAEKDFEDFKNSILRLNTRTKEDFKLAKNNMIRAFESFAAKFKHPSLDLNTVRGILGMFNSKIEDNIKDAFWALIWKTEPNIGVSYSIFNNNLSGKLIQDNYREVALYHIYDDVKNAVEELRFTNPDKYKSLREKYNIRKIDNKYAITIGRRSNNPVIITFENPSDKPTSIDVKGVISTKQARALIADFLNTKIPPNIETYIQQLTASSTTSSNTELGRMFLPVIGLVIAASDPDLADVNSIYDNTSTNSLWSNTDRGLISETKSSLNTKKFFHLFSGISELLGLAWHTNISNTLKNGFGNNVAAFTLTSEIYNTRKMVSRLEYFTPNSEKNSFKGNNVVYDQINTVLEGGYPAIGRPVVRQDVTINGKKKASRDLTIAETAFINIFSDFFTNLFNADEHNIYLQPSCFSDKNTHFLIPYNKQLVIGRNGKGEKVTLGGVINSILDPAKRGSAENLLETIIYNNREASYTKILNNLVSDYRVAFSRNSLIIELLKRPENSLVKEAFDKMIDPRASIDDKLAGVKKMAEWVKSSDNIMQNVISAFNSENLDFTEELFYSTSKAESFNETLEHNINLYCRGNRLSIKERIENQLKYFINDLIDSGLHVYRYSTPGLYASLRTKLGNEWFDEDTQTMKFYIVNETEFGQTLKVNPVLSAYFYTSMLLNNDYSEIIFGRSFMHPMKDKPTKDELDFKAQYNYWPESYYERMEANRLLASFKRTVIAGATTHTFYPSKYGVDPTLRFAVVKDLKANVFSMVGEDTDTKALDGSGLSSPIQSYLENMSLYDAKVGMDKKTIFGDTEGKYGTPTLLKWAVFATTNERRRNSMGSNISYETIFRKMHNMLFNTKIDLSKYYSPKPLVGESSKLVANLLDEGRSLTEHEYIYRYDPNTDTYWRINSIEYDPTTNSNLIYEVKVNKSGMVDRNATPPAPRKVTIRTIYDIDQALGGAYCMKLNSSNSTLEWSDANITTAANIICHNGLKDKMVGYLVNTTAIKVGARNINPLAILNNNNSNLTTTTMSLSFGGVQMDADHEIGDGTTVTEMSQMISALIQEGLETPEVVQLYNEIGQVVVNSLQEKNMLAKSGDFTKLHNILGKELIKTFSSGSKNTIGLAQSLLMSSARALKANANIDLAIPFSEPTVMGAFISDVISNINKTGIRRQFAGIAAVLCPSRGSIQYYNYDGVQMLYTKLAATIAKDPRYNNYTALDYIIKRGQYDPITNTFNLITENGEKTVHPFISSINAKDIDSGQTILVVTPTGEIHEVVIDNFYKFDRLRNLGYMEFTDKNGMTNLVNLSDCKLFNWSIKPIDLRQSDTTFQVNGVKHSIYDLDSVRAAHYINRPYNELLSEEKWIIGRCIERMNKVLHNFNSSDQIRTAILNGTNNYDPKELKELKKDIINLQRYDLDQIEHKGTVGFNLAFGRKYYSDESRNIRAIMQNYLNDNNIYRAFEDISLVSDRDNAIKYLYTAVKQVNKDMTLKELVSLYNDYILSDIKISDVNTRFAEIIMGRINAKSLGLREGDDISDVKKEGYTFFKKRLIASEGPVDSRVDKNSYDAIIKGANKENIYVMVRGLHETEDPITGKKTLNSALEGWIPNKAVFEENDESIYYNNKKLCKKGTKEFYSRPGVSGENHLLVVDSLEEANDLIHSDLFTRMQYNYTTKNAETLLRSQFKDNFDNKGTLKTAINLRQVRLGKYIVDQNGGKPTTEYISNGTIEKGTNLAELTDDIIKKLNDEQRIFKDEALDRIAKARYGAFIKQLEYIGARIPTQSMQSFMGLQLVAFTDSTVNEVYVPAVQTWLEGSDYDIDKLYIMGYSLNDNGSLFTTSRLRNYLDPNLAAEQLDTILALNRGNGITYKERSLDGFSDEEKTEIINRYGVTRREAEQSVNLLYPDTFNKILNSNDPEVVFSDDVDEPLKKRFLKMLNRHSTSKGNEEAAEEGLKNSIVNRLLRILKKPTVQIPAHLPITMDTFQSIASKSVLSLTEKRLTSDNPLTNFIMQVQNMVGKDVIGITAVGMKVFFATSTMVNSQILKMRDNLIKYKETSDPMYLNICNEILSDLVFKDPLERDSERIIANANLKPVLDILISVIENLSAEELSLLDRLQNLERTKDNINAAEGISQLLSCATDNAKELILSKINATVDFADAWVCLMAAGYTPEQISEVMMSPAFSIVQTYNRNDLFSGVVSSGNKKRTIEFVLGKSNLPGVDNRSLKIIMGSGNRNKFIDNNTFLSKLFYETYTETEYKENGSVLHRRGELKQDENGDFIPRNYTFGLNIAEILDENTGALTKGSDLRAEIFSLLTIVSNTSSYHNIERGEIDYNAICNLLSDHINYLIFLRSDSTNYDTSEEDDFSERDEVDYTGEDMYGEGEPDPDEFDQYDQAKENKWDFDPTDARFKVDTKTLQNLYNYLQFFLIPKNKQVDQLSVADLESLETFYNSTLPAVEEQTILGNILSVNQGIKTKLEEFMGVLRKIENFINSRLEDLDAEDLQRFNIIDFLNGDDSYKEE